MTYVNKELERRTTSARSRLNYKITHEDPVLKAAFLEKERKRKHRRVLRSQDTKILAAAKRMYSIMGYGIRWEDNSQFVIDSYTEMATAALYPERVTEYE